MNCDGPPPSNDRLGAICGLFAGTGHPASACGVICNNSSNSQKIA